MNPRTRLAALAVALAFATFTLHAQVPQIINYQGRIAIGPVNFDSATSGQPGQFKFALVKDNAIYWTNSADTAPADGVPDSAVSLTVTKGVYSVLLGDINVVNMLAIPASVFTNSDVRLRIWFNDGTTGFQLLTPDQRVAAVGYAMIAGNVVDGAITSAKIAPGLTLGGTTTGTFSGPLAGNVTGNLNGNATTATTATNFTGSLAGNVTGTQGATVVATVGGITAANVAAGANLANAAISTTMANTIVKRDASGIFSANTYNSNSDAVITQNGGRLMHNFGTSNISVGAGAGNPATTGGGNAAFGVNALGSNTTGSSNTAHGNSALALNTIGQTNTAVGAGSLSTNTMGSDNTALGVNTLTNNVAGNSNTGTGANALRFNSGGNSNTATGVDALRLNVSGNGNTAVGNEALRANTVGQNTALGFRALTANTTGSPNTATGYQALGANTTGSNNTATGFLALSSNLDGNHNTANGDGALGSNTSGIGNTAIGDSALSLNTSGNNNIGLGEFAGSNLTTESFNIDIGNAGVAGEANAIRIGGTQAKTFIAGIRGVTIGAGAVNVLIDGNGQLGTISSSRRYKEDIADMGDASARIQSLRPVTFRYKRPYEDGTKPIQFGLIAEEVAEVFPELAVLNAEGQPETVKYQDLTPLLLNELQKLRAEKDALSARLEKLEAVVSKIGGGR